MGFGSLRRVRDGVHAVGSRLSLAFTVGARSSCTDCIAVRRARTVQQGVGRGATGADRMRRMDSSRTASARCPVLRRVSVGLAVAMAWTLALLLPHLSELSLRGEGGRLFYMTGAWLALWIALPLSAVGARSYSRAPSRLLSGALIFFIVTQAVLLHSELGDWIRAGSQMQQLVLALRNRYQTLDGDRYAFVFAPDAIGATPFARNANGAMVLPPVQPKPLLKRMLVFRPSESAEIPPLVNRRLIPVLKTHALNDAEKHLSAAEPGADPTTLWPTDLMCWRVDTAALVPVTMTEPWRDATHWTMAIRDGLRRAGCE